jgi:hypothetical protein
MSPPSLPAVLMQITDGFASAAAVRARSVDRSEGLPSAEQIARLAILRRARENALRARVFGDPAAARGDAAHR